MSGPAVRGAGRGAPGGRAVGRVLGALGPSWPPRGHADPGGRGAGSGGTGRGGAGVRARRAEAWGRERPEPGSLPNWGGGERAAGPELCCARGVARRQAACIVPGMPAHL